MPTRIFCSVSRDSGKGPILLSLVPASGGELLAKSYDESPSMPVVGPDVDGRTFGVALEPAAARRV